MNNCAFLVILIISIDLQEVLAGRKQYDNKTLVFGPHYKPSNLDRDKRFILWENGGISKMVFGFLYAVDFGDKKPWRNLNCAYNLQAQYAVPQQPIYWWDKWTGRSLMEAKEQYEKDGTFPPDETRKLAYSLIEYYARKSGKNGKKCLLRAICDNAKVDKHEGLIERVLQVILTPGKYYEQEYQDAYKAGRHGVICTTLFPECPEGEGIFDDIFVHKEIDNVELWSA